MTDEPIDNERHHPRVRNLNLVQISRFDEAGVHADLATGRTLDISTGGIRLELHYSLPLRSVVELTLALDEELIEVRGKVVYLKEIDDERCAMGIQFTDVGPDSQRRLDAYVEDRIPDA